MCPEFRQIRTSGKMAASPSLRSIIVSYHSIMGYAIALYEAVELPLICTTSGNFELGTFNHSASPSTKSKNPNTNV